MSDPLVFISRFRVRPGGAEELRALFEDLFAALAAAKPRTTAQLAYLADGGTTLTIIHVFPDAAAMDHHFEGADERSQRAYAFMEPAGWEIYGRVTDRTLAGMRAEAASAGVELTLEPDFLAGFLRQQPA